MLVIKNGRVITGEEILEGMNVVIDNNRVSCITEDIPDTAEVIDAGGNYVSPGFIDIHIHGAAGCDTMDSTYESLNSIAKAIAKHGTTSFVATTMTVGADKIKKALSVIRGAMEKGTEGANVLGAHLEGPFLNPDAKGAHDVRYIREPDIDFLTSLVGDDFSVIRQLTIAPEVKGAHDFISFIVGQGIIPSIGHSSGTYNDAMKAIGNGASHSTHLYNAMRGFSHREPGVVGAIFDSSITTEFIADGIHLHFASIRTAIKVKGFQNIALITDAMNACTMPDGAYSLGGLDVYVKDGAARLENGTLAGSTLTLDRAVRNVLKNTDLNILEVVSMATNVPARILRINSSKGYIKPGYDADIVIFDDDINVKTTIVGGRVIE